MRLLKRHKEMIVRKAFELLIEPKVEKEKQQQKELGREVYEHCVPEAHRVLMKQLPTTYFQTSGVLRFVDSPDTFSSKYSFGLPYVSGYGSVDAGYSSATLDMPDALVPAELVHGRVPIAELPQALQEKLKKASDRSRRLRVAARKLSTDLGAMLQPITVVAKLKQAWPDCERFLPEEVLNPTTPNLPAIAFKLQEIEEILEEDDGSED